MATKRPNPTTIVVTPDVRDVLKHIARKDQSYTEIINDLIKLRNDHIEKENGSGALLPKTETGFTTPTNQLVATKADLNSV